jgi:hypothetical protein
MENEQLTRIEKLLWIIANELYVIRTDIDFKDAEGGGPLMWQQQGGARDGMVSCIEKIREDLERDK